MTFSLAKAPLVLHMVLETAGAMSFLLRPEDQLPKASEEAKLIMANYGGLLLATNFVCALFVALPFDTTSRLFAVCMATYHIWPMRRAYTRMKRGLGTQGAQGKVLGGPPVHLALHVVSGAALLAAGWLGGDQQ